MDSRLVTRARDRFAAVHALHNQGLTVMAITRELGLSRGTVRRFLRANSFDDVLAIGRGGRPSTRQHGRTGEQGGQVQPRRTARTPMPAHGASRFGSGSTCPSHPAPAADREERKSARRSGGVSLRAGAVAAGRYPSHAKAVTTVLSAKASGRRRTFGRTRATPSGARGGRPARPSWPAGPAPPRAAAPGRS
jgi:Homeodomain-like domain